MVSEFIMSQLIFKFPFKTTYYENDFYVSSNNFEAYKLIENWPKWPGKHVNIFGPKGCGKTHLSNILKKKMNASLIEAANFNNDSLKNFKSKDCLIIDNYNNNIDEKLLYSILNQSKQLENYILINSIITMKNMKINLKDLQSRLRSFLFIGIELPTDDLLKVIITKTFSDKQVNINPKVSEFIVNNVERSYEKMFKFLKDVDDLSLSTGKSININLIKKVLNQ